MTCKVLRVHLFSKASKISVKLISTLKIDCAGVFLCMCNFFENSELLTNTKHVTSKTCAHLKHTQVNDLHNLFRNIFRRHTFLNLLNTSKNDTCRFSLDDRKLNEKFDFF